MSDLPPPSQRLTARDADRLLKGEWTELALIRRGVIEDTIHNRIPVEIGQATEYLNLRLAYDRVLKRFGSCLFRYGELLHFATEPGADPAADIHPCLRVRFSKTRDAWDVYGYHPASRFVCKPDGICRFPSGKIVPVECKHSSRNGDFVSTEDRIAGWMPQLQATMLIFDAPYLLLSVLWNTDSHTLYWIPRDDSWQAKIYGRAERFRDYLINTNLSPTDQPAADLPVIKPLRFNAKAVKDWINAREPDHAAQP